MKFTRSFRVVLAVLSSAVASLASAQLLNESWRDFADPAGTYTRGPAFIKNGRVVVARNTTTRELVAYDPFGAVVWRYAFPYEVLAMRATTDNFLYITFNGSHRGVLALDQDGGFRWQLEESQYGNGVFSDNRIFGDNLLLCASGRNLPLASNPRTLLVSVNRFTGALNFSRELLIGGAIYSGAPMMRSSNGKGFLITTRPSGTGIIKFEPTTGDPIVTYAAGPVQALSAEVDSGSQVYFTGYVNPSINDDREFRRVDGSGTASMPLVYRKLTAARTITLSKGAAYSAVNADIVKIRLSDGAQLYQTGLPGWEVGLKFDNYGRPYLRTRLDFYLLNPDTGAWTETINVGNPTIGTYIWDWSVSAYGEIYAIGDYTAESVARNYISQSFSTMEPVDDVYSVPQGTLFSSNGAGVLANDRYTNPFVCNVTKVINSGPVAGKLQLASNGEFTFDARWGGVQLPVGTQTFRYRSTRLGVAREGRVTLNITRGLTDLTLTRPQIAGFSSVSGKVTISSAGPTASIALQDDSPVLTTPATVTVPANATTANFTLQGVEVMTPTPVNITATFETTSRTVTLTLVPLAVAGITCTSTVQGGQNIDLEVLLNGRPGPGGFQVTLSDNSLYVSPPPTVTIPEGQTSVLATATTTAPPTNQLARIDATTGAVTKYCYVTVKK